MNASALDAPRHIHIKTNIRNRVKQRSPRKKAGIVKSVKKARSSGTCLSMLSWGMTVWLIQFWLALSSLVALGATGALAAISENALGEIVVRGTSLVFDTVLAAASFALGYSVSFDMFEAIPLLFMLTLLLTWMVGLATLMAVGLQATLAGLRPMSGNGVGLKTGAILLALIGYFIPFANLFPWFVFWVLAIWRYPN
ncbi:hypothetical protein [Erythrobacter sp.]|nr:hypothetical protein [Erythrobacter sp.]MBO6527849.1 hypothetical protein [Erythrobacter sp.]